MADMLFQKKIVFVPLKGRAMSICEKKNPALEVTTFIFLQGGNQTKKLTLKQWLTYVSFIAIICGPSEGKKCQ